MEPSGDKETPAKFIPLACGVVSALLLTVSSLQSVGKLGNAINSQMVHLIGAAAALSSMVGAILYFALPKNYRKSKLFLTGVVLSFLTSVWGFALLRS